MSEDIMKQFEKMMTDLYDKRAESIVQENHDFDISDELKIIEQYIQDNDIEGDENE